MSEDAEKTLFFIKSPLANTTAVELFLKKRGFNVLSESDLKVAILEIMKIKPDYILLGWDHPSDRIPQLPKLILQSMMSTIIAYSSSNDKLHVRKLQASGQPLKLFPPLSGPAIQRLISRLEKEAANAAETPVQRIESDKNPTPTISASNMIQIKSGLKSEDVENFMNTPVEAINKPSEMYFDKGLRAKEIRSLQTAHQLPSIQNSTQFKNAVENSKKGRLLFSDSVKNKFNQNLEDQVQLPIAEMIEAQIESGQNSDFSQSQNETLDKTKLGFCIVIEHSTWCGYLILATEESLDPTNLEIILSNWITENVASDSQVSSQLILNCFEIMLYDVAFEKFSDELAEYSKTIIINTKKTILSFFSIEPEFVSLKLHDLHDMFEISINELPISIVLPFDLHLYLPENRKFLVYSKKSSMVAATQIERLKEKRVEKLYSSLENENSIQKFRAESRIRFMIEKFKAQHRKLV